MKVKKIQPGMIFGNVKVLSTNQPDKHSDYLCHCECLVCGKTFDVMFSITRGEGTNRHADSVEIGKREAIREFAEKIKSHMMMYCQGRIEQQYCALEVIDYIGKLMGEKDFSIDVEKEMAEHDSKVVREFAEWLTKSDYANGYFDTENGFVSVDKVLAEYEKEKKNG